MNVKYQIFENQSQQFIKSQQNSNIEKLDIFLHLFFLFNRENLSWEMANSQ